MKSEEEVREGLGETVREYKSRFKEQLKEPLPQDWIRPWLLGQIDTLKWILGEEIEE